MMSLVKSCPAIKPRFNLSGFVFLLKKRKYSTYVGLDLPDVEPLLVDLTGI